MKHRVGPSARSAEFFTGQRQTNDLHTELLEPAACQQHWHDIMLFNAPRGEIQYSYNHSHFAETQLGCQGLRELRFASPAYPGTLLNKQKHCADAIASGGVRCCPARYNMTNNYMIYTLWKPVQ